MGLIPGGIMNGIAGNMKDEPVLDKQYGLNWRTCEYWSPHGACYIWADSEMGKISHIDLALAKIQWRLLANSTGQ